MLEVTLLSLVETMACVAAATLEPPPAALGVTHWSSRLLADHLGVSFATVARIWRRWGLKPWKAETFKFSTDPELEAKIRDVVGLYLDPPAKAVVVCVDKKTQVRALDRTAPILPIRPGIPEKQTHDYKRNGTTTLFAALEVATGLVTDRCTWSSWRSSSRSPGPTRGCRYTWSATTTPPTSTPTSPRGSRRGRHRDGCAARVHAATGCYRATRATVRAQRAPQGGGACLWACPGRSAHIGKIVAHTKVQRSSYCTVLPMNST